MSDTTEFFLEENFKRIDREIKKKWDEVLRSSNLVKAIKDGHLRKELYAIYMVETYHYTSHNARNQAASGIEYAPRNPLYAKFCFHHAAEETGHELMALHDIRSLDLNLKESELPQPLPATEVLIAYLYWISSNGNPYRRLGYSLWAESSYEHINPVVGKVQSTLGLSDAQLTFFRAHSEIDDEHAKEVRQTIARTCKSQEDWDALTDAAITSLSLTGCVLDAVHSEYCKFLKGEPTRYDSILSAEN